LVTASDRGANLGTQDSAASLSHMESIADLGSVLWQALRRVDCHTEQSLYYSRLGSYEVAKGWCGKARTTCQNNL
jgi:hypothetical protein